MIDPTSPLLVDPSVVLLDATWLYGAADPSGEAYEAYQTKRIPGARFWSMAEMSEPNVDGFKYMLPSAERFARACSEHGITRSSHVVVYDTQGAFSAPRTVFTFFVSRISHVDGYYCIMKRFYIQAYGHEKVSLVDGGLYRAADEGVQLDFGPPQPFEVRIYPALCIRLEADDIRR